MHETGDTTDAGYLVNIQCVCVKMVTGSFCWELSQRIFIVGTQHWRSMSGTVPISDVTTTPEDIHRVHGTDSD